MEGSYELQKNFGEECWSLQWKNCSIVSNQMRDVTVIC